MKGMPERNESRCPICRKRAAERFYPFCSRRCADIDLNRWLSGVYAVPVREDDDEGGSPAHNGAPDDGAQDGQE